MTGKLVTINNSGEQFLTKQKNMNQNQEYKFIAAINEADVPRLLYLVPNQLTRNKIPNNSWSKL